MNRIIRKLTAAILIASILALYTGCAGKNNEIEPVYTPVPTVGVEDVASYQLGSTVLFDGIWMFFSSAGVVEINNSESPSDTAVCVTVDMLNMNSDAYGLNVFSHNCYYNATKMLCTNLSEYAGSDYSVPESIKPGVKRTFSLLYAYAGDGAYTLEFSQNGNKMTVNISITKGKESFALNESQIPEVESDAATTDAVGSVIAYDGFSLTFGEAVIETNTNSASGAWLNIAAVLTNIGTETAEFSKLNHVCKDAATDTLMRSLSAYSLTSVDYAGAMEPGESKDVNLVYEYNGEEKVELSFTASDGTVYKAYYTLVEEESEEADEAEDGETDEESEEG